ncbi:MAG: sugar ABC transporter substrate-binding protein [Actinomycetota bacterium]|nr:sugar ABC transporter substrate-binding protein [Actinomycetota bacterium]
MTSTSHPEPRAQHAGRTRHRNAHKLAALAAAGALFAACGTTSEAAQSPATSSHPSSSGSPVTISFLNVGATPQALAYFNGTVIPDFERANPKIRVTMETTDWGSAFTKITTAVASKSSADVFIQGGIWLGSLASDHALLPLTKYVSHWSGAKYMPASELATGKLDGTQYAIPYYSDLRGLWYNKADLRAAHLAPPKTLAQLRSDAAKLVVKRGGSITREGMDWAIDNSIGLQQSYTELLYTLGGHEFNAAKTAPALTSPTAEKALDYLTSFYKDGYSSTKFVDVGSAPATIAIGKTAMEVNGFAVYTEAEQYDPSIVKDLGFEPFPTSTGSHPVALSFPTKLGIYAGTKHPEQAWKFLSYIVSPAVESKWDSLIGELPADTNAKLGSPWSTALAKSFFSLASISKAQPVIPVMLKLGPIVNTDLEKAVTGQASPAKALAEANSSVAAMMK